MLMAKHAGCLESITMDERRESIIMDERRELLRCVTARCTSSGAARAGAMSAAGGTRKRAKAAETAPAIPTATQAAASKRPRTESESDELSSCSHPLRLPARLTDLRV